METSTAHATDPAEETRRQQSRSRRQIHDALPWDAVATGRVHPAPIRARTPSPHVTLRPACVNRSGAGGDAAGRTSAEVSTAMVAAPERGLDPLLLIAQVE